MKTKEKTKKAGLPAAMNAGEQSRDKASDLTDSASDREKLRPDTATIDLPDVEDIPGQEYIQPPTLESFVDDTIASADEEGPVTKKKKKRDEAQEIFKEEDEGLNDSANSDDDAIRRARLDDTDDDGDPLNEDDDDLTGEDLDIPGAADDDDDESIGEEDEENNSWSQEGEKEDKNTGKYD